MSEATPGGASNTIAATSATDPAPVDRPIRNLPVIALRGSLLAMSQRNLMLSLAIMVVCYACYVRAEQNPYARYVAAGLATIDGWALHRPPAQDLFNAAMNGMVGELERHGDEHSQFVNANDEAAFREDYDQLIGGVGVRMEILGQPPLPTVIGRPEEGSPAQKADIRLADRIEAVDGKPMAGVPLDEVMKLVRGPVGEPVTLTLQRRDVDEPLIVSVERGEIAVESIALPRSRCSVANSSAA